MISVPEDHYTVSFDEHHLRVLAGIISGVLKPAKSNVEISNAEDMRRTFYEIHDMIGQNNGKYKFCVTRKEKQVLVNLFHNVLSYKIKACNLPERCGDYDIPNPREILTNIVGFLNEFLWNIK